MFEILAVDVLQSLPSVGETAQLRRHRHGGGGGSVRQNTCLITLDGSANGLSILNILNGFGGF